MQYSLYQCLLTMIRLWSVNEIGNEKGSIYLLLLFAPVQLFVASQRAPIPLLVE